MVSTPHADTHHVAALDERGARAPRRHGRTTHHPASRESPPATPDSCSSPPVRTSTGFTGRRPSRRYAAQSPIPASSGKTTCHRLNPGGDRQANRALHLIAVCRLRYCDRTRAYAERRAHEGKSQREIMRCLKRYIAREVYNTPPGRPQQPPQQPRSTTTIHCGSPGFGITQKRA